MSMFATRCWRRTMLAGFWLVSAFAMSAETDGEADLDVRSPSVMAIRKSLVERHTILKEYYEAGVIGFTNDGLIAMREPARLVPDVRAKVERLVVEDNKDRSTMYREIARANGRPDWESRFQSVFAERWIRHAPVGWYYRDASGHWSKKLSRGAIDDAPANGLLAVPLPGN